MLVDLVEEVFDVIINSLVIALILNIKISLVGFCHLCKKNTEHLPDLGLFLLLLLVLVLLIITSFTQLHHFNQTPVCCLEEVFLLSLYLS